MLGLLLFRPQTATTPPLELLERLLLGIPGMELDGRPGDPHRTGRWRDPVTGAGCIIDLGTPPIEADTMHPPRAYRGWMALPLAIHVPFAGPHWFCVEALRVVETLLAHDPQWRALDEEDIQGDASGDAMPAPWDRLRVVASWERQRAAQDLTRVQVPVMSRGASVSMWRYRREAPAGRLKHPDFHWAPAVALGQTGTNRARSAVMWLTLPDPRRVALPPVELVVVTDPPRLIEAEHVAEALTVAGLIQTAGVGGARLVSGRVTDCLRDLPTVPIADYRSLDDEAWSD